MRPKSVYRDPVAKEKALRMCKERSKGSVVRMLREKHNHSSMLAFAT